MNKPTFNKRQLPISALIMLGLVSFGAVSGLIAASVWNAARC